MALLVQPPASQNLPDITENVTVSQPLSFAKRYPVDNAYNNRVHKSVSMESSRRWFADLVAEQIQSGRLFEDKQMPANDAFVKRNASPYSREFRWLRPQELTRNPKFIIDGVSRFDVRQGEIGDCWFLAALSSLSMYTDLLENVVPVGQSFETHGAATEKFFPYCGMFWFRFWQFGDWVDVVIDDRLPTRNGHLVFMHSSNRNEYWSALLEKAYAKLLGSYEAMHGGNTSEAMEDFTGGLTEFLELGTYNPLPYLFRIIEKSNERRSLMACSIDASPDQMEADGPFGLVLGHAYSVTDVKRFVHVSKAEGPRQLQLLRLRNPWGNDREWYGPWSDRSNEWNGISASERKRIGLVFEHDGEFWMSMEDFLRYFSHLEFCHLGPESLGLWHTLRQDPNMRRWEMTRMEGEWIRYVSAGGCRNYEGTFHMNPQFRVQVTDPDETDGDNMGTIIVGLMQKGRREQLKAYHTIGYAIYRLTSRYQHNKVLPRRFFQTNVSVGRSPSFINTREVCGRHRLTPGEYVIIPSTFEPNMEAKFLLRIFAEKAYKLNELDDNTAIEEKQLGTVQHSPTDDVDSEKLHQVYCDVAGHEGDIRAPEMRDILNAVFAKDFPFDGFSLETARSMVALMDIDLDGSLQFSEFKRLWMNLALWKDVFVKYDQDKSGSLDSAEFRDIMRALGIHLSNKVHNAIICRYADSNGRIKFDDYVLVLARLTTVIDTLNRMERDNGGKTITEAEEFVRAAIYT